MTPITMGGGKMPYYKFFISSLSWFLRGVKRDYYKKRFNVSLSESTYEETSDLENHAFNLDCLQPSEVQRLPQSNWPVSMTDGLYMKQIENYLFSISRNAQEGELFESMAFMLFKLKIEGNKNAEIAEILKVSLGNLNEWNGRLRGLLERFIHREDRTTQILLKSEDLPAEFFTSAMRRMMNKINPSTMV